MPLSETAALVAPNPKTSPKLMTAMRKSAASSPFSAALWSAAALLSVASTQGATSLTVANASFERPATSFVDTRIDDWQKTPQPVWFDPTTAGISWDQLSGVFANAPAGQASHINNLDGNQAIYLFALPTVGLSQQLSGSGGQFQAGVSYQLSVGMLGGGGIPEGSLFQLALYYLDASRAPVTVGSKTISYSATAFPTSTDLVEQTLNIPVVQATDAWAGQDIGIQLVALSGTGSGYWDLDHVQLTATAVPEPSTTCLAVLGVGALGLVWRQRRNRS